MKEEFEKIKNSSKPEDFQNWISKYNKSVMVQDVMDHKDSLELSIALLKESEAAVDDFIATHTTSTYLEQAQKIKAEMIEARDLFTKAKAENTVEIYERFLIKFPRSIHNTDAHKSLIDAAEKVGCDSVVTLTLTLNYTGLNEPTGSSVSISPNPTSSKITVKSSLTLIGEKFTIYDQQGKVVKSGIITAEETEIDLSNLSEGVYLFKAGTEMQETFKIIKQ